MSHYGKACAQGSAARMFAHHQRGLIDAHIFGAHDLIRGLVLEHSILMNARFMRERIRTDNGFIRLHHNARVIADQFADARKLLGFNSRFEIENRDDGSSASSQLLRAMCCPRVRRCR